MMGPTDIALQAVGKTKFIMIAGLTGFTLNLVLNFFLIPSFGMIGAAIAYLLGRNIIYLIQLAKLKRTFNLNPFDGKYLKTISISVCILLVFCLIFSKVDCSIAMLILLAFLFVPLYGILLYQTNAFCQEDIAMIKVVKDKILRVISFP